jgi:hypothetical protein
LQIIRQLVGALTVSKMINIIARKRSIDEAIQILDRIPFMVKKTGI